MVPVAEIKSFSPDLLRGRVMVVSNEDTPILVGHIIGFKEMSKAKQLIPVVQEEEGGEWICFGAILPYDEALRTLLDTLPGRARFELLRKIFWLHADLRRIERNQLYT